MVRKVVESQPAVGEQKILYGTALVPNLLSNCGNQFVQFGYLSGVLHVVGVNFGVFFFDEGSVVSILVDEDSAAVVVEGFPEKGLLGEAEDEEITWSGAFSEDVGDGLEIGVGHVEGVIGFGGVVEKGVDDGSGKRGGGGGGDDGRGGNSSGSSDGSSGGSGVEEEEEEEEGEGEEGQEGKQPNLGGGALFVDVRVEENEPGVIGIGFHFWTTFWVNLELD